MNPPTEHQPEPPLETPEKRDKSGDDARLVVPQFEDSKMLPTSHVLEVESEWVHNLWEIIKHAKIDAKSNQKPSIEEIDFDQKTLELDIRTKYGKQGSEPSEESKEGTLKTLPSYQGDYKDKSEVPNCLLTAMALPRY